MTLRWILRGGARFCGTVLLPVMMAGCQALDDMERENYQHECDNLGIARGTPTYDECMLQQQRLNEEEIQHSMDREEAERLNKKKH
ncbi:hypothetical protein [Bordetella sp. 2513F-2]